MVKHKNKQTKAKKVKHKKIKNGQKQKKYKMVKDMYKQTKAQDDQAQKERNKSTKWSKTKINKQRDKMVKYNPQIQTHDVNKNIHQNNNQHNDALTVGHQNVHIQPTKYMTLGL